jgi:hypothetical protein
VRLILFMVAVMAVNAGDLTEIDEARASSVVQDMQAKIDLEELLQPADADKLNCTQAWLLANSVLAANGYIFNDELALRVFTFDMVYSPNYEVTYYTYADYLNPADTWNLDLLLGVESARCEAGVRTLTVGPDLTPVVPDGMVTMTLASASVEPESLVFSLLLIAALVVLLASIFFVPEARADSRARTLSDLSGAGRAGYRARR